MDDDTSSNRLHQAFLQEQVHLLDAAMKKFRHCVFQLSDDQVWWRPGLGQNSIANLMLHVCGNMMQWIVCGVGGEEDCRDREAEFAVDGGHTRDALWALLAETVDKVRGVTLQVPVPELLRDRVIQGFSVSGLSALSHSVTHFVGHTHQVIQLTRQQLGEAYQFEWSPTTTDKSLPI